VIEQAQLRGADREPQPLRVRVKRREIRLGLRA
jgi:hypothetical protein